MSNHVVRAVDRGEVSLTIMPPIPQEVLRAIGLAAVGKANRPLRKALESLQLVGEGDTEFHAVDQRVPIRNTPSGAATEAFDRFKPLEVALRSHGVPLALCMLEPIKVAPGKRFTDYL